MPSNVPWRRAVRMSSTDGSWPRGPSQQVVVEGREDVEQLDAVFGGLRPVLIRDLNHFDALTVFVVWIVAVIEQMSMMPNSRPRSRSAVG